MRPTSTAACGGLGEGWAALTAPAREDGLLDCTSLCGSSRRLESESRLGPLQAPALVQVGLGAPVIGSRRSPPRAHGGPEGLVLSAGRTERPLFLDS